MFNQKTDPPPKYYPATVSLLGTTQIHKRNPYIVAWWSAAFPGLGHLLLSKYIRGFMLFIWEVVININSNLNIAMMHSFTGRFELAKQALDTRWLLLYIPVYLFAIWDAYRTCVDLNKMSVLAEHEDVQIHSFRIGALEVNYLDKRSPVMAVMWSLFMPGTGQLYIHRVISGFFALVWIIVMIYYSAFLVAFHHLLEGEFSQATNALNPEWFFFIPSLWGFSMYDAYINTVENNKLYEKQLAIDLIRRYQRKKVTFPES